MKRLIVASNRVAVPTSASVMTGGLAAGLSAALRETNGVWFGWSGEIVNDPSPSPRVLTRGNITYILTDLSAADHDAYYNGFANRSLWPLVHYRLDLLSFDRAWLDSYLAVNRAFARQLVPHLRPDDTIWIHDYHMIPLALELRRLGVSAPIGFFSHTPMPPPDVLMTLPQHETVIRAMTACDLVGFQTTDDLRNFRAYLAATARPRDDAPYLAHTASDAFPIGIDATEFAAFADSADARRHRQRLIGSLQGRDLVVGTDRADYSKGLPGRLRTFERFLERYPEHRGHIHLLQITPPTRETVPEYVQMERDLERLSGHINGRFAEFDWIPIRYMHKAYPRPVLASFFRAARVGLVTPLRDGMNLVAKEYVAAQDPANPGVLVLSQFAGAADQLDQALIVNPFDQEAVVEAIKTALDMPLDERVARWNIMMRGLRAADIDHWRDSFLSSLHSASGARVSGGHQAASAASSSGVHVEPA